MSALNLLWSCHLGGDRSVFHAQSAAHLSTEASTRSVCPSCSKVTYESLAWFQKVISDTQSHIQLLTLKSP